MYNLHSFIRLAACLALVLPITAATLRTRDIQALSEAFDHVFTGIDRMIVSLNEFKGDDASFARIIASNSELRTIVNTGTAKVKSSPSMPLQDVIHIGGPLFVMENKIGDLMEALRAQKAVIDKMGAGPKILKELQDDKVAVDLLTATINANLPMPGLLKIVADPIGKLVTKKIDAGITEWGGK